MIPIDTTTGLQSGPAVHGTVDVLVGYLVVLPDGFQCRLGPDRTRAEIYAAAQHALLEPMYVKRKA